MAEILNFQGSTHRIGVGSLRTLLNKISSLSKDKKFVLRELIVTPPALIGRWFYENVNKGLVKNVELIVKAEGGVEKYKRI